MATSLPATPKTYKRNYLSSVFLRLDFDKVELNFLKEFHKSIEGTFPYLESTTMVNAMVVNMNPKKIQTSDLHKTVWIFHNATKSKKLEISTDNIVMEYKKYINKKDLLNDVSCIFEPFLKAAGIKTINRIGLRYRNEINLNEIKENFTWDRYISSNLISSLKFIKASKGKNARAMGQLVLKYDDADITFNFGLLNNDFPAEVLRKEFILDYDCYSQFPTGTEEGTISKVIERYNKYVDRLFDMSITKLFKEWLNKAK